MKLTPELLEYLKELHGTYDTLRGDDYSTAIYALVGAIPDLLEDLEEAKELLADTKGTQSYRNSLFCHVENERDEFKAELAATRKQLAEAQAAYRALPKRLAVFAFGENPGDRRAISLGSAHLAVAHALTAKDGLDEILPSQELNAAIEAAVEPYKLEAQDIREGICHRIGQAINRACEVLPESYDLHIELERGAGSVHLYMPGNDASIDNFTGDDFADEINAAIDAALSAKDATT